MSSNAIRASHQHPTSATTGLLAFDEFDAAWKDGWRQTRRTLRGLGRSEARIIDDLTRGRGVTMLRQGFEIVREHSTCAADRVALAEQLRGFLLAGLTLELSEAEAMLRETEANEQGNVAQFRHAYFRSLGSRDAVIESMSGQEIASRLLKDTMWRDRPALIQAGKDW